jgi:phosphotransferase system enzyme I (PtsI)
MAGELLAIPLLLGLGLDEFSMNASAIPAAKSLIRTLSVSQAKGIADQCLTLAEPEAVRTFLAKP